MIVVYLYMYGMTIIPPLVAIAMWVIPIRDATPSLTAWLIWAGWLISVGIAVGIMGILSHAAS